jgi:hypothetical protein
VHECDLTARTVEAGALRGYLFDTAAQDFVAADGTRRSDAELRALASTEGQEVTYTCVTPGTGTAIAFNPSIVVADAQGNAPGSGNNASGGDAEGGGAMGWAWLAALWSAVLAAAFMLRHPGRRAPVSPSQASGL